MQNVKLEAMLLHLLNHTRAPDGKLWKAITVPGYPRFTREDVEDELKALRAARAWRPTPQWWQFWK